MDTMPPMKSSTALPALLFIVSGMKDVGVEPAAVDEVRDDPRPGQLPTSMSPTASGTASTSPPSMSRSATARPSVTGS
jgi:hypothetical protein